mmetsp:Transcript_9209/g.26368  ORF Transcript_9209/g.26368 Transcript_9209/m.26368 type:complete len:172 (+) Transcript_9209:59-574(+)|eukprot:CAMPEP_0117680818 /NCGR_PEP_ID=MMETSP0804-20121206/18585_1 /TAXON_ID=1074897 /ORGANISM="Tetraselmis astigmatica, Strain CCMP880" /LENGTH=171 /DNA_ID=CAMNT_0005490401 /DNA_START=148 /DNA_END=663 /DNA_ORIENTATION=+
MDIEQDTGASQLGVGASQTSVRSTQKGGKLTFSSAPTVPRAKQAPRADFTHNSNKLREIGYENSILVEKIAKISARGAQPKVQDPVMAEHMKVAAVSSAAINRRKAYDKIAEENLKMYNRLQRIKPSADTERKTLAAAHKQNEEYKRNCSVHSRELQKKKAVERREAGWQS